VSDTKTEVTPDEKPDEAVEDASKTAEGAPEGASTEESTEGSDPADKAEVEGAEDKDSELPEWARNELASVRQEAGRYRQLARDVKAQFEGAKTPEEFEAATADLTSKVTELEQQLLRQTIGNTHKLPQSLIGRLQGSTPEEIEADAKELQKLVKVKADPERLSGGLDPSEDDSFDPVAAARKARASRH
jgi:hypothetical protein